MKWNPTPTAVAVPGRAGKTGISISICHVKEKGKIREIERIINKKFEKGEMPTGHAICESSFSTSSTRLKR